MNEILITIATVVLGLLGIFFLRGNTKKQIQSMEDIEDLTAASKESARLDTHVEMSKNEFEEKQEVINAEAQSNSSSKPDVKLVTAELERLRSKYETIH